jgi:hypothetical protein
VGQLREDIAEVRRQKRAYVDAKPDAKSPLRPSLAARLLVYGGGLVGLYLIVRGDTAERIIGAGLVASAALWVVAAVWVYWAGVRFIRDARRRGTEI